MAEQAFPTGPIAGSEVGFTTLQIAGNEYGFGGTVGVPCNSCDPPLPDTYYLTLAGLGGDWAAWNGKNAIQWLASCLWTKVVGDFILYLGWSPVPGWYISLQSRTAHLGCAVQWYPTVPHERPACNPVGDWGAQNRCWATQCTDPNTCTDSAGATCVVSTS